MSDETNSGSDEIDSVWGEAMAEQAGATTAPQENAADDNYEKAQFGQLQNEGKAGGDEVNLDVILDIPVTLSVEIGRTKQTIRNLLQLNQGSVVELDRLAGEPMDVLVNGTLYFLLSPRSVWGGLRKIKPNIWRVREITCRFPMFCRYWLVF